MELLTPSFGFFFWLLIFLVVLFMAARYFAKLKRQSVQSHSPRVAAPAVVTTKRNDLQNHFCEYYITFEFTTGDRKEYLVSGKEYGLLRENDKGVLTFRGEEFIAFERKGTIAVL